MSLVWATIPQKVYTYIHASLAVCCPSSPKIHLLSADSNRLCPALWFEMWNFLIGKFSLLNMAQLSSITDPYTDYGRNVKASRVHKTIRYTSNEISVLMTSTLTKKQQHLYHFLWRKVMHITSIKNINHIRHFTILYLLVNFYRIRSTRQTRSYNRTCDLRC